MSANELRQAAKTLRSQRDMVVLHPDVSAALAEWLDQAAEIRADGEVLLGSTRWVTDRDRLPIALARLINGSAS